MHDEISEHRRSEDWARSFLDAGHRLGILASSDDHYGNPGHGYLRPTHEWDTQEIGMGLVAVHAPHFTREAIFGALYDRRVYATSGDRIILNFRVDGHGMGSEYKSTSPPRITVEAAGTAPITRVEIKKDGRTVYTGTPGRAGIQLEWHDPEFDPGKPCFYYARILQENSEEAVSSPIWVN